MRCINFLGFFQLQIGILLFHYNFITFISFCFSPLFSSRRNKLLLFLFQVLFLVFLFFFFSEGYTKNYINKLRANLNCISVEQLTSCFCIPINLRHFETVSILLLLCFIFICIYNSFKPFALSLNLRFFLNNNLAIK